MRAKLPNVTHFEHLPTSQFSLSIPPGNIGLLSACCHQSPNSGISFSLPLPPEYLFLFSLAEPCERTPLAAARVQPKGCDAQRPSACAVCRRGPRCRAGLGTWADQPCEHGTARTFKPLQPEKKKKKKELRLNIHRQLSDPGKHQRQRSGAALLRLPNKLCKGR